MIKICQNCKEKYNSRLIGDYGSYKCPSCETQEKKNVVQKLTYN